MINEENQKKIETPLEEQNTPKRKMSSMHPANIPEFLKPFFTPEDLKEAEKLIGDYWEYITYYRDLNPSGSPAPAIANSFDLYLNKLEPIIDSATIRYIEEKNENPEDVIKDVKAFCNSIDEATAEIIIEDDKTAIEFVVGHIDYSKATQLPDGTLQIEEQYIGKAGDNKPLMEADGKPVYRYRRLLSNRQILANYIDTALKPVNMFLLKNKEEHVFNQDPDQITMQIGVSPAVFWGSIEDEICELERELLDRFYPEPKQEIPPIKVIADTITEINEKAEISVTETINTSYPNSILMGVDKALAQIEETETDHNKEKMVIPYKVGKAKVRANETIIIDTSYLPASVSSKITTESKRLMNAVATYNEQGQYIVTPQMLYRLITANPKAKITPNAEKRIADEIDRLSQIRVETDISQLIPLYNIDADKLIYKSNLLSIQEITGTKLKINNTEVKRYYKILDTPILVKNAMLKKQAETIPLSLLELPINMTDKNLDLRDYLLERIYRLKGNIEHHENPTMNNTVLFSKLYEKAGIEETNKSKKTQEKRAREAVIMMLDVWKEKELIKDYKIIKKDNIAYYSVSIIL